MKKTKTVEVLVSCPNCGRDNFTPDGLTRHKCKGIACPKCGQTGFNISSVKEHKCQTIATDAQPHDPTAIVRAVALETPQMTIREGLEYVIDADIPKHDGYWLEIYRDPANSEHPYYVGWRTPTGCVSPLADGYRTLEYAIYSTLQYISTGWPKKDERRLVDQSGNILANIETRLNPKAKIDLPEPPNAAVVPATAPAVVVSNAPSLTIFSDQEAASKVRQLVSDAQDGLRRIIVCGLYLETIKNDLPHGQFGRWLEAYCPDVLARTAQRWMTLASNIREAVGLKYDTVSHLSTPIYDAISLPPQDRPEDVREACAAMDELMAGKSARQLLLEFKQAAEDENGNLVARRGRLPGSKTERNRKGIQEGLDEAAAESEEFIKTLKADLYLAATGNGITKVDRELLESLLHNAVELSNRIREILKGHQ